MKSLKTVSPNFTGSTGTLLTDHTYQWYGGDSATICNYAPNFFIVLTNFFFH